MDDIDSINKDRKQRRTTFTEPGTPEQELEPIIDTFVYERVLLPGKLSSSDVGAVRKAVEVFNNLSTQDKAELKELNVKIQSHDPAWTYGDPLISDFIFFMGEKELLPIFNWMEWSEGSDLFMSNSQARYDNIDLAVVLMLISAAIRKERFASGTLARAFESGDFSKLVKRLVELGQELNDE